MFPLALASRDIGVGGVGVHEPGRDMTVRGRVERVEWCSGDEDERQHHVREDPDEVNKRLGKKP